MAKIKTKPKSIEWKRTPGPHPLYPSCGARHLLYDKDKFTDWYTEHCGHPTANYPYVGYRRDGARILAPNGRGFQYLKDAQAAVLSSYQRRLSVDALIRP